MSSKGGFPWRAQPIMWEEVEGFDHWEFAPEEDPHPDMWEMHPVLIGKLANIRKDGVARYREFRIIIHRNGGFCWGTGHKDGSLHYGTSMDTGITGEVYGKAIKIGRAVDFHCEMKVGGVWKPVPWLAQALLVYKEIDDFWWGIGLHPEWNQPGLHLDYRMGVPEKVGACWYKKDGLYRSYGMDEFDLCLKLALFEHCGC